jgi:hypothetical protein
LLAENVESSVEALKPMFLDALKRLSFGIKIIRVDVNMQIGQTPHGPMPMVACIYTAKGKLIGPEHDPAQITMVPQFVRDQSFIDDQIEQGCKALRDNVTQQITAGNGKLDISNLNLKQFGDQS